MFAREAWVARPVLLYSKRMCCKNLQVFHNYVSLTNLRWDNNPRLQGLCSISLILSEFTPHSNFHFEYLCICFFKKCYSCRVGVVIHAFLPESRRQRKGDFSEFEANLIYWEHCRITSSSQRNPFSKMSRKRITPFIDSKCRHWGNLWLTNKQCSLDPHFHASYKLLDTDKCWS